MIKRSILAVTRRKTKTVIFLIFLFVVSSLVLCSISIKNATNESMKNVKKSLSSEVSLSQDMSKLRENFEKNGRPEQGNFSREDMQSNLQEMHDKMNANSAKKSDVDKISSIKYVVDVKYTVSVDGEEDGFDLYESSSSSESSNEGFGNGPGMMPDMGKMNSNSLEIEGINTFKLQDGYTWKDNTTTDKTFNCSILQGDSYLNLNSKLVINNGYMRVNSNPPVTYTKLKSLIDTNGVISHTKADADNVATCDTLSINLGGVISNYILILPGDITKNGLAEQADVTLLFNYLRGKSSLNTCQLKASDVTNDNGVHINDVAKLYQFVNNKIEGLGE